MEERKDWRKKRWTEPDRDLKGWRVGGSRLIRGDDDRPVPVPCCCWAAALLRAGRGLFAERTGLEELAFTGPTSAVGQAHDWRWRALLVMPEGSAARA